MTLEELEERLNQAQQQHTKLSQKWREERAVQRGMEPIRPPVTVRDRINAVLAGESVRETPKEEEEPEIAEEPEIEEEPQIEEPEAVVEEPEIEEPECGAQEPEAEQPDVTEAAEIAGPAMASIGSDVRAADRAAMTDLDGAALAKYLDKMKHAHPSLASHSAEALCEMLGVSRGGVPTLMALLLFGTYPQAFFPQFSILALSIPGVDLDDTPPMDNLRIEGTLLQMLKQAVEFIRADDRASYPFGAVCEAVWNALVHRDYSAEAEGTPIRIFLYDDRLEVCNPVTAGSEEVLRPVTRNPSLARALETLEIMDNRYFGISAIQREMRDSELPAPEFHCADRSFCVTLRSGADEEDEEPLQFGAKTEKLLSFCKKPRSRQEIASFLNIQSVPYAITAHVTPLVEKGRISLSIPDRPRSPKQRYTTVTSEEAEASDASEEDN